MIKNRVRKEEDSMAQHISIRVPWHDNGWNGTVCKFPGENNACLRLKNIRKEGEKNRKIFLAISNKLKEKFIVKLMMIM